MKKKDFYFELPQSQIAQHPVEPRDNSRLLRLNRQTGEISHFKFYDLCDILAPGDCLILNDSRVFPARLYGKNDKTGGSIEYLLLNQVKKDIWEIICRHEKKARIGENFSFLGGLKSEILEILEDGKRLVKFDYDGNFYDILNKVGQIPLPPYIFEKLEDSERYQTIYSRELGSVAAPTAGLHFTQNMFERLKIKGVGVGYVTLHVGLGTFRPVKVDDIEKHIMHAENYYLPKKTADLINQTRKNGKRVFSVGTTSCRTLESVYMKNKCICEDIGSTDIFIYPGFKFNVVDCLVTNFHLPESTLIMLVSAFSGYNNTMRAYKTAVREKYRFFSFGDAMVIV